MKYVPRKSSPFVHDMESSVNLQLDLFAGLLAVMIIAIVQNGLRVLVICLTTASVAWATEVVGLLILGKPCESHIRSLSLGLVIALLCPVTIPILLPAAAAFISVLFVRIILRKNHKTLFMTPVIAWLFLLSVAPAEMTGYPAVRNFKAFELFENMSGYQKTQSIAQMLQTHHNPSYTFSELLTGNYAGGMGTTCIFIILAVCVYFIYRKSMAWEVSLSMILTVCVFSLIFNRTGCSPAFSVLYELSATSLIFVAVFVAGDIINAPMMEVAKLVFGIMIGVFTMIFRYFGLGEHCVVLALFICNFLSEPLDLAALKLSRKIRVKSLPTTINE